LEAFRTMQTPMTVRASALANEPRASVTARLFRLATVVGLHFALASWIWHAQADARPAPAPLQMHVQPIEIRVLKPQESAIAVVPASKPQVQPAKPLPRASAAPVVRRSSPAKQPAVQTAAPAAAQAPASVASTSQPPTPATEAAAPAPAPASFTAARFDAAYLQNPEPVFPLLSRKLQEEGKVLLLVQVSANGEPESVQVKQSSGYFRLDDAALKAVRKWRFAPARRGTEAIASSITVPLVFRLDS
jgi:periplasmic protein TonB